MKCPKCGSEKLIIEKRIDGYCHCLDCGWNWKPERKQPEPSTAEMLLWLARYNIDIIHASFKDICSSGEYVIVKVWQDSTVTPYKGKTLDEAVKRAYDWAIKEERNV